MVKVTYHHHDVWKTKTTYANTWNSTPSKAHYNQEIYRSHHFRYPLSDCLDLKVYHAGNEVLLSPCFSSRGTGMVCTNVVNCFGQEGHSCDFDFFILTLNASGCVLTVHTKEIINASKSKWIYDETDTDENLSLNKMVFSMGSKYLNCITTCDQWCLGFSRSANVKCKIQCNVRCYSPLNVWVKTILSQPYMCISKFLRHWPSQPCKAGMRQEPFKPQHFSWITEQNDRESTATLKNYRSGIINSQLKLKKTQKSIRQQVSNQVSRTTTTKQTLVRALQNEIRIQSN